MSSDLISRQAAIDILLEKLIQNGDMYLAADAPKWVESLPTAFDKEKAMQELRDAAVLKNEDGIWYVALKDALDISRKAGLNEQKAGMFRRGNSALLSKLQKRRISIQ